MIAHCPDPFPDELLYSVLARCKRRLSEPELAPFCYRLFGDVHARAKIDLQDKLEFISRRIPNRYQNRPEAMAQEMTLLRYYAPFLRKKRALEVEEAMLRPNLQKRVLPALSPLKLGRTDFLRFCPACWQKDKGNEAGERYWRRSHQAAGSVVCWLHETPLSRTPVKWSFRESWQTFVDAASVNIKDCEVEPVARKDRPICQAIAKDIHWLLNTPSVGIHAEDLTRAYWDALSERRLVRGPHIQLAALKQELINRIGKGPLRRFRSEIRSDSHFDWTTVLVRPSRVSRSGQPPLRHLLLIQALGHSAETFFRIVADSQMLQTVGGVNLAKPQSIQLRTLQTKIAAWWPNPSVTRNEMARRLGISTHRLNTTAAKLRLPFPRGGTWGTKMRGSGCKETDEDLVKSRRRAFKALCKEHPTAGTKELIRLSPKLLRWLRSHDYIWLADNRPARLQRGGAPRLDWATRDTACAQRIAAVHRDLTAHGQKLSLAAIERALCVRIDQNRRAMPRTVAALEAFNVCRANKSQR